MKKTAIKIKLISPLVAMDYRMETHRDRVNIFHYENLIFPCFQRNSCPWTEVTLSFIIFLYLFSTFYVEAYQSGKSNFGHSFSTERDKYTYIYRMFIHNLAECDFFYEKIKKKKKNKIFLETFQVNQI